ncbi:MAG: bifunctional riboflavin kinase/FAD synthetase [Gammaproteobacteria bacterium]
MELIRGLYNMQPRHRGCVATIGNYDGLHLGHRQVLEQLVTRAGQMALPSLVMCFEPTPQEFFVGSAAPPRLSSLRDKYEQLNACGVDRFLCVRFNRKLSQMSADNFIEVLLVNGMGIRHLVVGDDFRFGHDREGTFSTLVEAGRKYGFDVADTESFKVDNERVSSTLIREALEAGELGRAGRMLGRHYTISGRVIPGEQLGRQLGFPTANISLGCRRPPLRGVFAVRVDGLGRKRDGVANLGTRPTVDGRELLLEVHIFDFADNIYGQRITIDFVAHLRDEARFDDIETMTKQMEKDAEQAKQILAQKA